MPKTPLNGGGCDASGSTSLPRQDDPLDREPRIRTSVARSSTPAAEVRAFRSNMAWIRRQQRGPLTENAARLLWIPLALYHSLQGVLKYGRGVRDRHGITIARQFQAIATDYRHRLRFQDFYSYRSYLDAGSPGRQRHFPFHDVLTMVQYLIEVSAPPDFPPLRSKMLFAGKCEQAGLPTVPVIAQFADGKATPGSPCLPQADLFSKPDDLYYGLHTQLWRWMPDGAYQDSESGEVLTGDELCARLAEKSRTTRGHGDSGSILLQRRVVNHESLLGRLTTGGLITVRVVTCRTPENGIDILPPSVRLPVGAAVADNFAKGGLSAPVDSCTGRICGPALRRDDSIGISVLVRHPTTGVTLEGFQIPCWPDVLALARRAHRAFLSMQFVGWDIAVLPEGPVLIEGNAWWGMEGVLLPHGLSLTDTQFVTFFNHHLREARRLRLPGRLATC